MNQLKIYGLLMGGILLMTSCGKDWLEEYQPDPTRPTDVSVDVLLPSAQAYYGMAQGDVVPRLTGIFMQQMTGADRQSLAHNRYAQIGESDFDNVWADNGYAGGMKDLEVIISKTEGSSPHYAGVAKIMMAQYLGLFTDLWGDIPYSEALLGADNLNPAYQSQESIYATIDALLVEGIANCQAGESTLTPGSDDYYYGGVMDNWVKYAYSLRARYFNHLSKLPQYDAGAVLAAVSNGFTSSADDALQPYGTSRTSSNPWYQFLVEDRVGYIEQNGFMYSDVMEPANDPRLPFYRSDDELSIPFWGAIDAPLNIMTYFELKFIEAEATLSQGGDARAALEEAITANMDVIGVDAADRDAYIAALPATTDLELIMTEKYVAMFAHYEAWTDWRRTGFPGISVFPDANLSEIPRRLPYAESERLYNDNFINLTFPSSFTQRMWWDE